ncbi:MAG: ABC transporter permease [Clostridia bacterium]|nr:ABC transporter permease [Clostridia bacterium]MBR4018142.1 ABC transporter permease [Clostridia bacterium]
MKDMAKNSKGNNFFLTVVKEYTMIFVLIAIVLILCISTDLFLVTDNIMNLFRQSAVIGIISIGAGIVVIGGTFDMSVGSLCTLCGCVCLILQETMGVVPAMLICLGIGATVGLINGVVITSIKGNSGDSFMVTFGMLTVLQAITLLITGGYPQGGSTSDFYNFFGKGTIGGVFPVSILVFFILTALAAVLMQKTLFGRRVYYMGSNREAARLAGVEVNKHRIISYVISGLCAAMAAIVLTGRINGATSKMGHNFEFDAMTAIVVGGISLAGGKGNMINMLIGVFIMATIGNGMNILGIQTEQQYIVRGLVLIIAVLVDVLRSRKIG